MQSHLRLDPLSHRKMCSMKVTIVWHSLRNYSV